MMGSVPALRRVLEHAQADGVGVGHFNVSDLIGLKAVFEAARGRKVPVVVGVSEGERAFIRVRQVAALVKSLRDEYAFPVFLNADHTHSLPNAIEAAKAGFDWIVFDRSTLPLADNIRQTREAAEALKSIRPDILVEGEVGNIGSGSEIHDGAPATASLTTAAEARQSVEETRVHTLAPAVGNMHGMFKTMVDQGAKKKLDIERIREIKAAAKVFLTLHGASGTDEGDLRRSIAAGITVVHINTEMRIAWRRGLEGALASQPGEIVPYKVPQGGAHSLALRVLYSKGHCVSYALAARTSLARPLAIGGNIVAWCERRPRGSEVSAQSPSGPRRCSAPCSCCWRRAGPLTLCKPRLRRGRFTRRRC